MGPTAKTMRACAIKYPKRKPYAYHCLGCDTVIYSYGYCGDCGKEQNKSVRANKRVQP